MKSVNTFHHGGQTQKHQNQYDFLSDIGSDEDFEIINLKDRKSNIQNNVLCFE